MPGREEILDALLHVAGELDDTLAEDAAQRERQALDPLAQPVGPRVGDDPAQHLADRADVGRDGHAVVVHDQDDVAIGVARVVHPLVGEPAGERAVADDRHDLVLLALEIARRRHAQCGRHGGAGVPGPELVVLALAALEKAGDSIPLAQRGELLVAAGQELPGVGLMPHVPDDLVTGRIELVQEGDAQLDHAEAGADVTAGDGAALDQPVADLLGQLGELVPAQALEIFGGFDRGEQSHGDMLGLRSTNCSGGQNDASAPRFAQGDMLVRSVSSPMNSWLQYTRPTRPMPLTGHRPRRGVPPRFGPAAAPPPVRPRCRAPRRRLTSPAGHPGRPACPAARWCRCVQHVVGDLEGQPDILADTRSRPAAPGPRLSRECRRGCRRLG